VTSESRPAVFLASSSETLDIAEALQVNLVKYAEVTIWSQGVFGPSSYILDAVDRQIGDSNFAILVVDAEDVMISRGETSKVTRDNLLVEYGLAVAHLGRERTFLVHDADKPPKLPSDMLGINTLRYRRRSDGNLEAMTAPIATQLRSAMGKAKVISSTQKESPEFLALAIRYLADAGSGIPSGRAGVDLKYRSDHGRQVWRRDLLQMIVDLFGSRASDVAVGIFTEKGQGNGGRTLSYFDGHNLSEPFYPYAWNEGLAGRVWASGVPAAHSAEQPHAWWVVRTDCLNATYLCAPLGAGDRVYGILSVGSNQGFSIHDSDLRILEMFAQALSATVVQS
jgi:hypothetical protein